MIDYIDIKVLKTIRLEVDDNNSLQGLAISQEEAIPLHNKEGQDVVIKPPKRKKTSIVWECFLKGIFEVHGDVRCVVCRY